MIGLKHIALPFFVCEAVLLAQGQWDSAIQECERIQQSDPLFYERHLSLGRAYLGKERAKDALREFDEAERHGIQVPGVYHDLAVLYAY